MVKKKTSAIRLEIRKMIEPQLKVAASTLGCGGKAKKMIKKRSYTKATVFAYAPQRPRLQRAISFRYRPVLRAQSAQACVRAYDALSAIS